MVFEPANLAARARARRRAGADLSGVQHQGRRAVSSGGVASLLGVAMARPRSLLDLLPRPSSRRIFEEILPAAAEFLDFPSRHRQWGILLRDAVPQILN